MGNLSLHKELDFILQVNRWRARSKDFAPFGQRDVVVRTIKMRNAIAEELPCSSKFDRSPEFIRRLRKVTTSAKNGSTSGTKALPVPIRTTLGILMRPSNDGRRQWHRRAFDDVSQCPRLKSSLFRSSASNLPRGCVWMLQVVEPSAVLEFRMCEVIHTDGVKRHIQDDFSALPIRASRTMKRIGCIFSLSLCFAGPVLAAPPLPVTGSTSTKHPFPECPREVRWPCRCISRIRQSCAASA